MRKLLLFISAMFIAFMASAQMPEAITLTPSNATPFTEFTLTLNTAKSCPSDALFHADSVMIHSGVNIDGAPWQNVVDFDGFGANGQSAKLTRVGPGFPDAITLSPGYVTAWDEVTITLDTRLSCPDSALFGADSVMMHSGVTVNGAGWSNVVDFDGEGANGQKPKLTHNGDSTWSITIVPAEFYGLTEGDTVTAINCVFNGGGWDQGEGKDFDAEGNCTDFTVPIGQPEAFLWSITYNPSLFYDYDETVTVTEINCVFNGGAWDAGEAKDFDEEMNCTDFVIPIPQLGIGENQLPKYKIYPNPVSEELTIEIFNSVDKIEVYNVIGTKVKSYDDISTEIFKINTSDLTGGFYFLTVWKNESVHTSKFVKR